MVHPFHSSVEDYFDDFLKDYTIVDILEMAGCSETDALVALYRAGLLELPDALDPTTWEREGSGEP